jgi:hypothetical protein
MMQTLTSGDSPRQHVSLLVGRPDPGAMSRRAEALDSGHQKACVCARSLLCKPARKQGLVWAPGTQSGLVYIAVVTPYVVAFASGYRFHSTLGAVDLAINVLFMIDVVLNFRTAVAKGSDVVGSQVRSGC